MRGFRFALSPEEKLLGGGERVMGMDRRGQRLPLYNRAHYGYTTESNQMYFSLPAVLSSNKYILLFDNSATGTLDLGANEEDILQFEAVAGRTAYIVVAGATYPQLLENYVSTTGKQPLPPVGPWVISPPALAITVKLKSAQPWISFPKKISPWTPWCWTSTGLARI